MSSVPRLMWYLRCVSITWLDLSISAATFVFALPAATFCCNCKLVRSFLHKAGLALTVFLILLTSAPALIASSNSWRCCGENPAYSKSILSNAWVCSPVPWPNLPVSATLCPRPRTSIWLLDTKWSIVEASAPISLSELANACDLSMPCSPRKSSPSLRASFNIPGYSSTCAFFNLLATLPISVTSSSLIPKAVLSSNLLILLAFKYLIALTPPKIARAVMA